MQYIHIVFSFIVIYNIFLYLKSKPRNKFIMYLIIIFIIATVMTNRYNNETNFYQGFATCKDTGATSRSDVAPVSYRIMESASSHESYNEYIIRNTNYINNSKNIEIGEDKKMCNQILQTAVNVKYKIGDIIHISGAGEEGAMSNFNYDEFIFYKYHADKIYTQYKSRSYLINNIGENYDYAITFTERIKLWRDSMIENIFLYHDTKNAELLAGMIYGREITLSKELKTDLRDVGLTHIAVMSGYNVMITSLLIYFLIKQISKLFMYFKIYILENIYIKTFLLLTFLSALPVMTSFGAPIVRAYIFIIIFSIYNLMGRVENYKRILLITILSITFYYPHTAINDIGLHLSTLAVAGLIYTEKYIFNFLQKYLKRIPETLIRYLSVTLAAQTFVTPYIIYVFGIWHPISIIANLLVGFTLPIITITGIAENTFTLLNMTFMTKIISFITEGLTKYIIYVTTIL